MKRNLVAILFTIIFLVPFLMVWKYIIPLIDMIAKGMSSRESGHISAFIVFLPAFIGIFLADMFKNK